MKRTLTLILTALLAASAIGCQEAQNDPGKTNAPQASETEAQEPIDSLEARQLVKDDLGSKNFEGKTFVTLSCNENIFDTSYYYGEETGNVIHDKVYERDRKVEERFKFKFQHNMLNWNEHADKLTNAVLSDDDVYQLYLGQAISSGNILLNDYLMNWKEIPNIDYEKPWYTKVTNDAMTINGKNYLLHGSMSISYLGYTYCMFMNQTEARNLNLPNIYETVNNGEWTYDKLNEYATTHYKDVDGNGKIEEGDFYAYATREGDIPTFMWSFDADIVEIFDDGSFEVRFGDERTVSIAEKLVEMLKNNEGVSMNGNGEAYTGGILMNGGMQFSRGLALIASGFVKDAISPAYLDMNDPYAIIPYPKFDENQKEYHTMSDGSYGVLCAPITVQDIDMLGTIAEACNAEAWKIIEPAYYDLALKTRGVRDEESVAMLDMILNSRIMDFAYLHDGFKGFGLSGLQTVVTTKQPVASYVAKTIKGVERHYQGVLDFYFAE